MNTLIDHAMWLLTGGRDPSVHIVFLHHRVASTNQLPIPESYTEDAQFSLGIPANIKKLMTRTSVQRMAIDHSRPVQHVIPFHLSKLPIKGLTLPMIRVITRIRHFHPKFAISAFIPGIATGISNLAKLPEFADVFSRNLILKYEKACSVSVKIIKPVIHGLEPRNIPRYFVRIKPSMFARLKPSEIVMRRIGMASALGIPREMVDILAIFMNVEIISTTRMEYCEKSNTLILKAMESMEKEIKPEVRDVVVGCDTRSGQIHIALYRHRGES